jgi:phosphoribosylformylglycinamidine cyclo-ligase
LFNSGVPDHGPEPQLEEEPEAQPEAQPEAGAYASAGVDTNEAGHALDGLVAILKTIDTGRPTSAVVGAGHYASVLALDEHTGIALCTDGVGTKLIVAEQAGRFDTVGIDCVAMNVNDLICVGAEPRAMVDYHAVEQADPEVLAAIGRGLKAGAELAGIEIPGGELAQLPEMVRGHPSPHGFDLVGAAVGTVALDRLVTGDRISPGDVLIGLPSSGLHSNGFTLARRSLLDRGGLALDDSPSELGRAVADELLQPTEIYVRAVLELLASDLDVRGLAHITGDGMLNLLRLNPETGYEIDEPLPTQPVFALIRELGQVPEPEMHQVFNMGTGFVCVTPAGDAEPTLELLRRHYSSAARIGRATADAGTVVLAQPGLAGGPGGFRAA